MNAADEMIRQDATKEGNDVRFVLAKGQIAPAKIVRVNNRGKGLVNLTIFADTNESHKALGSATAFRSNVAFDAKRAVGTWHFAWSPED